ncbi:MAG: hypothetical protein IID37_11305, partial [Planctomycetes bacterium]|nr:hypothetical protein [Planctomycetota bacterium]
MQQRKFIPSSFVPAREETAVYPHHVPQRPAKLLLTRPFRRRLSPGLALALLLAWLPGSSGATDFSIERLARTGDPVPGIEGAFFTLLAPGYHVIDGAGNVMFYGVFDDGEVRAGYFFGQPDDYGLLLEWKDPAIGFDDPAMAYQAFFPPNLAEDGTLALQIEVGDIRNAPWTPILYAGQPDQLEVTIYEDGPAPGYPDGALLLNFNQRDLNALGEIATWGFVELEDEAILGTILAGEP